MTVSGSVFRFNIAARRGGAILGDNELHISDSRFTANTAGVAGGAIWNNDDRTNLTSSTLRRNTAPLGGAIYNLSAVELITTRVTANTAALAGGGIYNDPGGPASVTLTKSTVTANTPDNCAPAGTVAGCKG